MSKIDLPVPRWALLAMAAALLAPMLSAAPPADLDGVLNGLLSPDMRAASAALDSLLLLGRTVGSDLPECIANVMRDHPEKADALKMALIKALENANAFKKSQESKGQVLDRDFSDYWPDLIWAVGLLRDQRAVNALMGSLGSGGMVVEFLADLLPYASGPLAEAVRSQPRSEALIVLGASLTRQALIRANPTAAARIRAALLESLASQDWLARQWAADGLALLRDDPEVRARLQTLAREDPYIGAPESAPGARPRFLVREAASDALAGKRRGMAEAELSFVTRTPEGLCRVQKSTEVPNGDRLIGPVPDAGHQMCIHYDRAAKDPFLCWQTNPVNACGR